MHIETTIQSENSDINQILSFHDSNNPQIFFQNSNAPFALNIMNCHPNEAEPVIMSTLLPGSQFNYTINPEIKSMKRNSMHQHNHLELRFHIF